MEYTITEKTSSPDNGSPETIKDPTRAFHAFWEKFNSEGLKEEALFNASKVVHAFARTCNEQCYIETNSEAIEVAYFPESGRAGISWGSYPEWTDADSVEDAIERFLGINDKFLCN